MAQFAVYRNKDRRTRSAFPLLRANGPAYLMLTPQLAGIATSDLGPAVGNLAEERPSILRVERLPLRSPQTTC